jgi:hypothetical protein
MVVKISLTFYVEIILIYLPLFKGEILKDKIGNENSKADSTDYTHNSYILLDWMGYLSIIGLILKVILLSGLGN